MIKKLNEDLDFATEKQLDEIDYYLERARKIPQTLQESVDILTELYTNLYVVDTASSDVLVNFASDSEECLTELLIAVSKFNKRVKTMTEYPGYDGYI